MKYVLIELLVEDDAAMSDEDKVVLFDEVVAQVVEKGLRVGGSHRSMSDADFEFWTVVKGHLTAVYEEVRVAIRIWWESVVEPLRFPWD